MPIVCGGDSLASALHLRLRATPRGPGQIIMTLRAGRQKAELLILRKPDFCDRRLPWRGSYRHYGTAFASGQEYGSPSKQFVSLV